jgi:hypothetical protein
MLMSYRLFFLCIGRYLFILVWLVVANNLLASFHINLAEFATWVHLYRLVLLYLDYTVEFLSEFYLLSIDYVSSYYCVVLYDFKCECQLRTRKSHLFHKSHREIWFFLRDNLLKTLISNQFDRLTQNL